MAYDYADDLALAKEMINEFGRDILVERLSRTAADPTKPWRGAAVPTIEKTHKARGAFLPHTGENDLGKFLVDKELLKRCEQVVLVAGTGKVSVDLNTFHQVDDDGVTWKLQWAREFKPGDTSLLYVLGVSR